MGGSGEDGECAIPGSLFQSRVISAKREEKGGKQKSAHHIT